ncbi:hypothetical protein F4778DRAFT_177960 [Xylariomycetidae sp. FL2044]|nr:hypothetical protein F4778DRAFT_177960 [Xylariomycetidae sp. FL2044]
MVDHKDPTTVANAVSWTFTSLAVCFLSLRLWCRTNRHNGLWWDDYLLTLSMVILLVSNSSLSAALTAGYGKTPLSSGWCVTLLEISYSSAAIATAWSKTAFAITLLKITKRCLLKGFLWVSVVGLNVISILWAVVFWAKTCESQDSEGFASVVLPGPCWSVKSFGQIMYTAAAYSAVMDLALALYPWPLIWTTRLYVREKFGLGLAMSLGILAAIVAIIRIVLLADLSRSDDPTWYMGLITVTNILEPGVTIIAQSVPVFRVLLLNVNAEHPTVADLSELERNRIGTSPSQIPSHTTLAEDPFRDIEDTINLRLIKRPDGRIVPA